MKPALYRAPAVPAISASLPGARVATLPATPHPPVSPAAGPAGGIVHLTAECWPFARTGGLGEAVAALARHQAAAGQAVTVLMPLYRTVRDTVSHLQPVGPRFTVELAGWSTHSRIFQAASDEVRGPWPARVLFLDLPEAFDRPGLYGERGTDYPDNPWRFALFCRAALSILPWVAPEARVVHAHDWHTALAPVYLRTDWGEDPFHRCLASILSVHNAGYQGHCAPETMRQLGLPAWLFDWRLLEWYGRVNLLKGGVAFADAVVTVSPTHARELCAPDTGFGLHGAFAALEDRLVGITNGIDQDVWDPSRDPNIAARFDAGGLAGKRQCKAALQQTFGLPESAATPVVAVCARLAAQKGVDLLLAADVPAAFPVQLVVLGEGEPEYARALTALAAAMPDRVAARLTFQDRFEHVLLAGADLLLMPSRYEPCGLTQMRAQRYGAIPVAHRVGGLADTIEDGVTGFLFDEYTPAGLVAALRRALDHLSEPVAWRHFVRTAMARDFGWERSVERYQDVYQRACHDRARCASASATSLASMPPALFDGCSPPARAVVHLVVAP